jgi:hypothetical protein
MALEISAIEKHRKERRDIVHLLATDHYFFPAIFVSEAPPYLRV